MARPSFIGVLQSANRYSVPLKGDGGGGPVSSASEGRWAFKVNGITYVGEYVDQKTSRQGRFYILKFANARECRILANICEATTENSDELSWNGPPSNDIVTGKNWREPEEVEDEDVNWAKLSGYLHNAGYVLWPKMDFAWGQTTPGGSLNFPNGYMFVTPIHDINGPVGSISAMREAWLHNGLNRVARSRDGSDVMIRILAVGEDGREQLDIWRLLSTAPCALFSHNHALPLLQEIDIGHMTLGVFPLVAQSMEMAYNRWAQNSVGDILDMMLQALEYTRPLIPEMGTGETYDPFKLDVWQLASSFNNVDFDTEPVTAILNSMASLDPSVRLTANEALSRLRSFVETVPPKSLLIPPIVRSTSNCQVAL
ncbi:hypothetical protein HDZ31DRAFT_76185 [Schizophyllum fasciatum]